MAFAPLPGFQQEYRYQCRYRYCTVQYCSLAVLSIGARPTRPPSPAQIYLARNSARRRTINRGRTIVIRTSSPIRGYTTRTAVELDPLPVLHLHPLGCWCCYGRCCTAKISVTQQVRMFRSARTIKVPVDQVAWQAKPLKGLSSAPGPFGGVVDRVKPQHRYREGEGLRAMLRDVRRRWTSELRRE